MKLFRYKKKYKRSGEKMKYHTVKILLNSLYGKFIQLIYKDNTVKAGSSWNPIYGAIITANVRVRISELQTKYKSIVAVHTDSLISTTPLPYGKESKIGKIGYETEGNGVIIGSGVYQIGEKTRIRGFNSKVKLLDVINTRKKKITFPTKRPWTWREVAFHNWSHGRINRFHVEPKQLTVDFDGKRIWIKDYKVFKELLQRRVESVPYCLTLKDFGL